MGTHTLRILHISDIHERAREDWRRRRVLGDAWLRNVEALVAGERIDLVCCTGDVAFSGKWNEYEAITPLFDDTLRCLGLPRERLFLVPGNHDIDRDIQPDAPKPLRDDVRHHERAEVSAWIAGGRAPRGFDANLPRRVLERQRAWRRWLKEMLGRPELVPGAQHPRLGYRVTLQLPGFPFPVQVLGYDTSWLAHDDSDARKLMLTDDQVMRIACDAKGDALPGLRLALMHHPLTDLADGEDVRRLLADRVDLLLRGHLHEPELSRWADPDRSLRELAAGCLYEHDRYPNECHVLTLTLDDAGHPLRAELRFRSWGARGHWYDDNQYYAGSTNGRALWWGHAAADAATDPPHPRVEDVFVGRDAELRALADALLRDEADRRPVAIGALHGMAGVGKSYLADRFATQHRADFPGGYLRLALDAVRAVTADDLRDELCARLRLPASGPQAWDTLRRALLRPRALVHVENVDAEELAAAVSALVGRLSGCALMVSGRLAGLGRAAGWARVEVRTFSEADALRQLEQEHRPARDDDERRRYQELVHTLGGLPLAIHLAAGYLAAGQSVEGFQRRLHAAGLALAPVDVADPTHAREGARAILRTTLSLSLDRLAQVLPRHLGAKADEAMRGLRALSQAPAAGVGRSLGAAMCGLDDETYETLVVEARRLSILDAVPEGERTTPGERVHPLLAVLLAEGLDVDAVTTRTTEWFVARLPARPAGEEEAQGHAWREVHEEGPALAAWLDHVPDHDLHRVERAGSQHAIDSGPFHVWASFAERAASAATDDEVRSDALWTLCRVAWSSGDLDRALDVARKKAELDEGRGADRGVALARGTIADILQVRGQLDDALRIRREEELPVYERLGDVRSRAITMGQIADILQARGQLDDALRIRREEQLPVYERLGDVRARAVTMGKIADVLQRRGQLDEALRIRREEELPVYERLGDVHARAVTMGKIADVLQRRGQLDEALRIRSEEELPVFERLGDVRSRAVCRTTMALGLWKRDVGSDRTEAASLLRAALADAEAMRIPEAAQIRTIMTARGIAAE